MRKHGNSEQAKPIKAVLLITPANPDKQLKTDVLVDASKTNDHTNVKTAQLNVSTVANEENLKLNSSNICDGLKTHLLSKSVDVTKEARFYGFTILFNNRLESAKAQKYINSCTSGKLLA